MRSTLRQLTPASSVTWIKPSSEPTYSRPAFFGLSAIAEMFPYSAVDWFFATASGPQSFPMTGSVLRSICRVRSGETVFQLLPLSSER